MSSVLFEIEAKIRFLTVPDQVKRPVLTWHQVGAGLSLCVRVSFMKETQHPFFDFLLFSTLPLLYTSQRYRQPQGKAGKK